MNSCHQDCCQKVWHNLQKVWRRFWIQRHGQVWEVANLLETLLRCFAWQPISESMEMWILLHKLWESLVQLHAFLLWGSKLRHKPSLQKCNVHSQIACRWVWRHEHLDLMLFWIAQSWVSKVKWPENHLKTIWMNYVRMASDMAKLNCVSTYTIVAISCCSIFGWITKKERWYTGHLKICN
jgi:hypothetical protein